MGKSKNFAHSEASGSAMNRSCPLCENRNPSHLWTITRFEQPFDIKVCPDCSMIYQDPLPEAHQVEELYDQAYYTGQGGQGRYTYLDERTNPRGHRAVNRARIRFLLRIWRRLRDPASQTPEYPVFLDVGCSFGALVQEAQMAGCDAHGIDISGYAVQEGIRAGLDIRKATPESLPSWSSPLDLVTMIEVIEHLPDPASALRSLARAMQPGGILVIQTANMDGRQARRAGSAYHYYLPGHLVYFSRKTLTTMLSQCGFDVVRVSYPCEFGLRPKLVKSQGTFRSLLDYRKWLTITRYHLMSKLHWGEFAWTSGMVIHARRRDAGR